VGHSLTLADVYLVSLLVGPFKHLFDKKTRLAKLNNLTRFVTLNLTSFHFEKGYGVTTLCKKSLTPPSKPVQKKEETDKKEAKPAQKKDAKPADKKEPKKDA